jgi:hypothetical protein
MVARGDTFSLPIITASGERILHLNVVLTDPHCIIVNDEEIEAFIIVNATSIYPGVEWDKACKLVNGDHQLITHDSYIIYKRAKVMSVKELDEGVQRGLYLTQGVASAALLRNACRGLEQSVHASPKIKKIFRQAIVMGYAT